MKFALLLVLTALLASCGGDGRGEGFDSGIYRFDGAADDAAMPVSDARVPDASDGAPDAMRPAAEGEPCTTDFGCQLGLECTIASCEAVGGVGESCTRDGACDPDLLCVEGLCVETVEVRLCHCIFTAVTMMPVQVEMQVGEMLVGPTPPNVCSPCVSIPLGSGIPLEIRRTENGDVMRTGTLDLTGDTPVGIVFSAGVFEAVATTCEALTGFCS